MNLSVRIMNLLRLRFNQKNALDAFKQPACTRLARRGVVSFVPAYLVPLCLLFLLFVPREALAGRRFTVWAYPPGAGPQGAVEAETWITAGRKDADSPTQAEYRLELENGITDDVSLDVYLAVVKQATDEATRVDRVQTSLRANLFGDSVRKTIDLTGYVELKRDLDFGNPWEFEAIFIGGHSYGRFSYDFNLVYESELSSRAFQKEIREMSAIVGAGYELAPRVWTGAELMAVDAGGVRSYSVGPTVSLTLTEKTWLAIGPQFGLNHEADHLKVRALFGIFF